MIASEDALYLYAMIVGQIVRNNGSAQLTNGALVHDYASRIQFDGTKIFTE